VLLGWPHVVVIASGRLERGEELYIDYGPVWWRNHDSEIEENGQIIENLKKVSALLHAGQHTELALHG